MWLIVGLGNPGTKYLLTRHNIGFLAVDFLAKSVGAPLADAESEFQSHTVDFRWDTEPVKLVKPQTYMNVAGEAVGEMSRYFKVNPEKILVLQDDLDQPFGQIRFKSGSGDGGHNGIKSLIQHLGTKDFPRLKIGIGRPPNPNMAPADYVLQKFSKEEQESLSDVLNNTVDAIECYIFEGPTLAMNKFNKSVTTGED